MSVNFEGVAVPPLGSLIVMGLYVPSPLPSMAYVLPVLSVNWALLKYAILKLANGNMPLEDDGASAIHSADWRSALTLAVCEYD